MIRITGAGWLYIAMTFFLGVSAVNTGNNLVYLITAAFLSFLGVSGFFGKSNIDDVQVLLDAPEEIYANTEFPLQIRLENTRRFFPSFLIRVRVGDCEALFPYVGTKDSSVTYIGMVLGRRGRHGLGVVSICSAFPFNFFVRCRKASEREVVVFPQPKRCDLSDAAERRRTQRGEAPSERRGTEGELLSLRDYTRGDPLKYIHWKASAKSKDLKTKELSSLAERPVIIDFETTNIANKEERISCITYTLLRLYRRNVPAGLRIGGKVFDPGTSPSHKNAMLRELALYDETRAHS